MSLIGLGIGAGVGLGIIKTISLQK